MSKKAITTNTTNTTTTTMMVQRLWRLIRKALLWARKSGALNRNKLVTELRVVCNRLRSLRGVYDELHYKECELSFDETPKFQLKMFKSKFCCNDSTVDSDNEHLEYKYDDDDDDGGDRNGDALYLEYDGENYEYEYRSKHEDGGIDRKADEFIAKFYQQARLQRELSMQKTRQNNAKRTE